MKIQASQTTTTAHIKAKYHFPLNIYFYKKQKIFDLILQNVMQSFSKISQFQNVIQLHNYKDYTITKITNIIQLQKKLRKILHKSIYIFLLEKFALFQMRRYSTWRVVGGKIRPKTRQVRPIQ